MDHAQATKIWQALEAHKASLAGTSTRDLFAADADRFAAFSHSLGDVLVDFSKNRVNRETLSLLLSLARACNIEIRRDEMFGGQPINTTEGRSVLHVALRAPAGSVIRVDGKDVVPDVRADEPERASERFTEGLRRVLAAPKRATACKTSRRRKRRN